MKLSKVVHRIEEHFPLEWAEEWDHSGLLVGDNWAEIRYIMLAVDPSAKIVEEAASKGADMLITHHPPDLAPPSSVIKGHPLGNAYFMCAKSGIAFYVMHSVLDVSPVSPNHALAAQLRLVDCEVLKPIDRGKYLKVVVFVPESHLEQVRVALCLEGAGNIGNYSDCTFSTPGVGTFLPGREAKPFSGVLGQLKKEKERRLETIIPVESIDAAILAIKKSHPYEEPAFDIYPVLNTPGRLGFGQIGDLLRPTSLLELAQELKATLPSGRIAVNGKSEARVTRVAIITGSGGDFVDIALSKKADVLITGEAKYHQLRYAEALGLPVIIAGHFATEWVVLPTLKNELDKIIWEHPGDGVIDIAKEEHSPVWVV
ncbi:Nif3-like dinuclear metal center hexameric protein [bacterium]|nr:Nif3-like dinuclear metal center hexameric protein [bacterium]